VIPCPVQRTRTDETVRNGYLANSRRGKSPLPCLRKSHQKPWNNPPKTTIQRETKHDDSVEIFKKSPDDNLETTHDDNSAFNTCPSFGRTYRESSQLSVKFYRWLRKHLHDPAPWALAQSRLATLYANL